MPPYQSPPMSGGTSTSDSSERSAKSFPILPPLSIPHAPATLHISPQGHISHLRTTLNAPELPVSVPFVLPPVGNLPVYSTSGFDILSLLARIATRPNPKITLGPVDMTCSFVVVDVRRYDHPIVYCSETFCKLTGYSEDEILGRNCRFLQAPGGAVQKGEPRQHTSTEAVALLRRSLVADKECQVSLVNYRKNGQAFINLVTVIPVPGGANNAPHETDDVVYQVGFQVDLTEQPNAILQKLRDGSYMVNYSNNVAYPSPTTFKDWKTPAASTGLSKQFRAMLNNPEFVQSIPLSTETTTLSLAPEERSDPYDGNRFSSLMLLETAADMILVMSLKGAFLFVSPSVRRVLGYDPEDLVGKGITDFCYEADKVPLIRELKESSSGPITGQGSSLGSAGGTPSTSQSAVDEGSSQYQTNGKSSQQMSSQSQRNVDLLFRILAKNGNYVWVECSGRLFVEPGKGRKAIILSGRVRSIPALRWQAVARAGGLATLDKPGGGGGCEGECWALLSKSGSFLYAGTAVRDVLGWGAAEVIGRAITEFVAGADPAHARAIVHETLQHAFADPSLASSGSRSLECFLRKKDGTEVRAHVVFYHPQPDARGVAVPGGAATRPLVCQIRVAEHAQNAVMAHALADDVFAELDTARGRGWQVELQQLKHENQRLLEQIEEIEAKLQERQAQEDARAAYRHQLSQRRMSVPGNAWATHLMSHPVPPSLKRSWDGSVVGSDNGRT